MRHYTSLARVEQNLLGKALDSLPSEFAGRVFALGLQKPGEAGAGLVFLLKFFCLPDRVRRALVLFKKSRRYLPRSAFGQIIDYAPSNWPLLGVYIEDGRIEIDTHLAENSIRPTARPRL
jgi:hypothetical protein